MRMHVQAPAPAPIQQVRTQNQTNAQEGERGLQAISQQMGDTHEHEGDTHGTGRDQTPIPVSPHPQPETERTQGNRESEHQPMKERVMIEGEARREQGCK